MFLGIGQYLWRLIPANPILLRVVEGGGRRKRDLLIRCTYLGALIFVVILLLLQSAGSLASASLSELNKTSTTMFYWMSYAQLFLVSLLAPIFTAGAITQEQDANTYDILLSTPLTNGQILLGSLLSRLFFVVALLVSGIPIFAITQIFGGVAISSIVMSFLIACATAFITGATAIAMSVFRLGSKRSILGFYLFIILYLGVPLFIEQLGYLRFISETDSAGRMTSHISWLAGVHPFLALRVLFGEPGYRPPDAAVAGMYRWPLSWYLRSPQTFYVTLMFVLSFVMVTPSILVLRRLAQSSRTLRAWVLEKLGLSGERRRRPRRVWSNPIAWREAKTRASANRAVVLRYGFMVAGLAGAVVLAVLSSKREEARMSIGAGGYDQPNARIIVREADNARFEKIEPISTRIFLDEQACKTDVIREGMVITQLQKSQDGSVSVLKLRYPKRALPDALTRQVLLGGIMVEFAIILLILTQAAASTATREKEDGTLDLVLCTPITSHYYIWGKLRGLVSFVLPLVAVPVASIVLFIIRDILSPSPDPNVGWTVLPESVLLLPGTLVMVTAFAAILGMHMSLRCKRTVMAVMSSVGIVAGVCGSLWFCGTGAVSSNSLDKMGVVIGCFSPFTLIALLVDPLEGSTHAAVMDADTRIMMFLAGWAAVAAYGAVVWGMYRSMVHNFDMTIRKQAT